MSIIRPFEIKENQQNPPKSTSDKMAEQSAFANLKNIFNNDKRFAFKASAFKTILKIILTKSKLSISKKFPKQVKVG
ncbi:hypothetical protein [Epilithonimonas arachidiradicis]|uniref:Uncharacterized protein n=1 Tax=Epilithonimonas arachidiradicis TaxID=1617282 RepID=A0ABQ1WWS9_9FLAO|nr:hypothetical protein [Epilithonimonas arachidiradicis]GGG48829.1 hypothetical protein GCM10007332_07940 [Epilithonimonas arachidiradicis]